MGSPTFPALDQLLGKESTLIGTVLPNLIEFPNLPSIIKSPSYEYKGFMLDFSTK